MKFVEDLFSFFWSRFEKKKKKKLQMDISVTFRVPHSEGLTDNFNDES